MSGRIVCPGCRSAYTLPDHLQGKRIRCKKCGRAFSADVATSPEGRPAPAQPAEASAQAAPLEPTAGKGRTKLWLAVGGVAAAAVVALVAVLLIVVGPFKARTRQDAPANASVEPDKNAALAAVTNNTESVTTPRSAALDFKVTEVRKSVVFIQRLTPGLPPATGSGFVVSADGLIATNRHVIQSDDAAQPGTVLLVGVPSANDVEVLDFFKAEPVYRSPSEDVDFAVLKIALKPNYGPLKPLSLGSGRVELGDGVAVLGYPPTLSDRPVLSFTKGSISSTRVELDGKPYYQTDAAVNPGNSGGPLVNRAGEVIGVVTFKRAAAENMSYALYWNETRYPKVLDEAQLTRVLPERGPLDSKQVVSLLPQPVQRVRWDVHQGTVKESRGVLAVDNNGGHYWLTSKDPLPENFQLVIKCYVDFLQGKQRLQISQRNLLRMMCVRFGTEDTSRDILDFTGYTFRFTHALAQLIRDKELVARGSRGNPDMPFVLTIAKRGQDIVITVNGQPLLKHHDDRPLPAPQKFSIGGYLSRLYLGEVQISDLGSGPFADAAPVKGPPRTEPARPIREGKAPDTAEPTAPADPTADPKKELTKFEGKWQKTKQETLGRQLRDVSKHEMFVVGDEVSFLFDGRVTSKARVVIDPRKSPRTIDLKWTDGRTSFGIYRFTDDGKLEICINQATGKATDKRPTQFSTVPDIGSGSILYVFEKEGS